MQSLHVRNERQEAQGGSQLPVDHQQLSEGETISPVDDDQQPDSRGANAQKTKSGRRITLPGPAVPRAERQS